MGNLLWSQASDDEHGVSYFSSLSINPQGQLCLSLNRRMIFATIIEEVLTLGRTYGSINISRTSSSVTSDVASSTKYCRVNLVHYSAQEGFIPTAQSKYHSKDVSSTSFRDLEQTETRTVKTRTLDQLDLSEGRSLLVLGLLRKLLEARGHSVSCYTNIPQVYLPPSLPPPPLHICIQ